MNINDLFPGEYLRAADLQKPVLLTIVAVSIEAITQDEEKPVLEAESGERIVLNKTNANTLASMYGPETEGWIGQPVVAYAAETDFQGRRVPCIRLRAPKPRATQRIQPQPPAVASDPQPVRWQGQQPTASDEDVPF